MKKLSKKIKGSYCPIEDLPAGLINAKSFQEDFTGGFLDLWILPIHLHSVPSLSPYLSNHEKTQVDQLHINPVRNQYIHARACLRILLGKYLSINPLTLDFDTTEHGKPFAKNHPSIFFNISHSKDLLCIGITDSGEIGVDIEYETAIDDLAATASRVFSQKELLGLCNQHDQEKLSHFFKIWTRKEACLKALGIGFLTDPEFYTVPHTKNEGFLAINQTQTQWKVKDIPLDVGVRGAFCLKSPFLQETVYDLAFLQPHVYDR